MLAKVFCHKGPELLERYLCTIVRNFALDQRYRLKIWKFFDEIQVLTKLLYQERYCDPNQISVFMFHFKSNQQDWIQMSQILRYNKCSLISSIFVSSFLFGLFIPPFVTSALRFIWLDKAKISSSFFRSFFGMNFSRSKSNDDKSLEDTNFNFSPRVNSPLSP